MNDSVTTALYVVTLAFALWSTDDAASDGRVRSRPLPVGTVAALLAVGAVTCVQLTVAPDLLDHLERNGAAIADGQVWRLVTSLFVQDGGWSGAIFNLVALALIGTNAELHWGLRRWSMVVAFSGLGAELWGLLVQPIGGGNSVVNFGLAASIAVVNVVEGRGRHRYLAGISLLAALALLVDRDLHGGAAAIGGVVGLLLYRAAKEPDSSRTRTGS